MQNFGRSTVVNTARESRDGGDGVGCWGGGGKGRGSYHCKIGQETDCH